ncbi:MAG: hypothetical protein ABSF18_02610, partial [Gammaproteobacteria bacterium]
MPKYVAVKRKVDNNVQLLQPFVPTDTQKNPAYLTDKSKLAYLANFAPSATIRRLATNVLNEQEIVEAKNKAFVQNSKAAKRDIINPTDILSTSRRFFGHVGTEKTTTRYTALSVDRIDAHDSLRIDEDDSLSDSEQLNEETVNKLNVMIDRHNNTASFWGLFVNFLDYWTTFTTAYNPFLNAESRADAKDRLSYMDEYDKYSKDVEKAYIDLSIEKYDLYKEKQNQKRAERALQSAVEIMAAAPQKTENQKMILASLEAIDDTQYVPYKFLLKTITQQALKDENINGLIPALNLAPIPKGSETVLNNDEKKHCYQLALAIGDEDPATGFEL